MQSKKIMEKAATVDMTTIAESQILTLEAVAIQK
jgi:hypothetical protein